MALLGTLVFRLKIEFPENIARFSYLQRGGCAPYRRGCNSEEDHFLNATPEAFFQSVCDHITSLVRLRRLSRQYFTLEDDRGSRIGQSLVCNVHARDKTLLDLLHSDFKLRSGYMYPRLFRADTRDRGVFGHTVQRSVLLTPCQSQCMDVLDKLNDGLEWSDVKCLRVAREIGSLLEHATTAEAEGLTFLKMEDGSLVAGGVDTASTVTEAPATTMQYMAFPINIHFRANALKVKREPWEIQPRPTTWRIPTEVVIRALAQRGNNPQLSGIKSACARIMQQLETTGESMQALDANELYNIKSGLLLHELCHAAPSTSIPGVEDPPELMVSLLPYQQHTVEWMCQKETVPLSELFWVPLTFVQPQRYNVRANIFTLNEEYPEMHQVMYSPILNRFQHKVGASRGGMLYSEMGLGKTIMMISLILRRPRTVQHVQQNTAGTLIVCPVSLIGQWAAEIEEKAPHLTVHCYHGSSRKKNWDVLKQFDVVITSYGVVVSERFTLPQRAISRGLRYTVPLEEGDWHRIVLDESHLHRNGTRTTRACTSLKSHLRWCMSGTPMVHGIHDLYHQYNFLHMDFMKNFNGQACQSLWNLVTEIRTGHYCDLSVSPELMLLLKHTAVRHSKQQRTTDNRLLLSLPDKQEETVHIPMTRVEQELYARMQSEATSMITAIERGFSRRSRTMRLLKLLDPLRRFSSTGLFTHMRSLHSASSSSSRSNTGPSAMATESDVQYVSENTCSICLSEFQQPCHTPCHHYFCTECIHSHLNQGRRNASSCPLCRRTISAQSLTHLRFETPTGGEDEVATRTSDEPTDPPPLPQDFSKIRRLQYDLQRILGENEFHKVLIFTNFNTTVNKISRFLQEEQIPYSKLTGSMTRNQRTKALMGFQQNASTRVFLLSTRSSAVGINLTSASHIILFDVSTNNAAEKQAIGRAWRMGQTNNVKVLRYISENSIESRLHEIRQSHTGRELARENIPYLITGATPPIAM